MRAANFGQVEIIQWLLSLGADVSAADEDGFTPLHGAVMENLATAKLLYEAGADINARSKTGRTLLYEAAVSGKSQITRWLLSLGADVLAADENGFTPLHGAVTKDLATAKLLHEAGADINARSKTGRTLLHSAAYFGRVETIQWLLSLGADVLVVEEDGFTPLHEAVTKDLTAAELLYEAGADINARSKTGRTLLFEAAVNGKSQIVRWLLSLGADVSAADENGFSPLLGAVTMDLATAKLLYEAGADINTRNNIGQTLLHGSVYYGNVEMAQWLLSLGADVSAADEDGFTPLHRAVTKDLATAKSLYEAGADINARSKEGKTILYEAALNGQFQTIQWLLSLGVDFSTADR